MLSEGIASARETAPALRRLLQQGDAITGNATRDYAVSISATVPFQEQATQRASRLNRLNNPQRGQ